MREIQVYAGQYLQVLSVIEEYEGDLHTAGRDAASRLVGAIRNGPAAGDRFLARFAVVLFTQAEAGGGAEVETSEPLQRLCAGISEGLGNRQDEDYAVPLIGCSVASVPDLKKHAVLARGFSLALLAARPRDLTVRVGGSAGFVDEEDGHQKAWTECLSEIERQEAAAGSANDALPHDGFVMAFFPGLIEGAMDFKARNLASYLYLRSRISADLPILGAGAGEFGRQRRCHVMAGREIIHQGYACAKVHTTLRFKVSMEHDLNMAPDRLLVKKLREGVRGKSIESFAVLPTLDVAPAPQVLASLQEKYETDQFAFRAVELGQERDSLLFLSIKSAEGSVDLVGPVNEGTYLRPARAYRRGAHLLRAVGGARHGPPGDRR